ncbi:hypothetical protein DT075_00735 [Bacillus licheniformis]|nr:hypothetical protein DT075_00735 [Bacillus licheniformis]
MVVPIAIGQSFGLNQGAKECHQENELKMHIAVIRSLCDVIVEPQQGPSVQSSPYVQTANKPSSDQLMLEKMMGSAGAEQYKNFFFEM